MYVWNFSKIEFEVPLKMNYLEDHILWRKKKSKDEFNFVQMT